MNIVLLTPVRLLGDGLTACLAPRPDVTLLAVVQDMRSLERMLSAQDVDLVLIDVTQGVNLDGTRSATTVGFGVAGVVAGGRRTGDLRSTERCAAKVVRLEQSDDVVTL